MFENKNYQFWVYWIMNYYSTKQNTQLYTFISKANSREKKELLLLDVKENENYYYYYFQKYLYEHKQLVTYLKNYL